MLAERLGGSAQGTASERPARLGWRHAPCVALLGLAVLCSSSVALAQDAQQKAAAEALFNKGQELLFNRDYEAACHRFEQSQAIDPGVGTLLYLGECYERLGRLASSWATYREAESAARAAGQADRSRVAHERAQRLLPNLSKLSLAVASENRVTGFELTINGKAINPALFDVPFHVDAGRYELVARAPGREPWSSMIEVQAGGEQKAVQVPALQVASATLGGPAAGVAATPAPNEPGIVPQPTLEPIADAGAPLSSRQTVGLVVAGAGVLATLGGVVFGVNAKNKDDEARPSCPDGCATRAAAELNQDARTYATFANISYVLGGAAIATGAVLFFLPTEQRPDTAARRLPFDISAELGRGRQLFTIGGAF